MNTKKIYSIASLLVILGFLAMAKIYNRDILSLDYLLGRQKCQAAGVKAASPTSQPITDWQSFEETEYKYALEYPAEWKVETGFQQPTPYPKPTAILKRQTFTGAEGLIDLDVWIANGHNIEEWLAWIQPINGKLAPVTIPNAKVAGYPALTFVETGVTIDMLTTFISDGDYVYRFWYGITPDNRGLQAYWHMIETFFPANGQKGDVQIPDDIERNADVSAQNSVAPLTSTCCGYSNPGNPFSCCCCPDRGNCTWWVYYKMGGVPFRGDAGTWWDSVPYYYEWGRDPDTPPSNKPSIAWWSGSPGHVAHIANYTWGNQIKVTEMFWCSSCGRTHYYYITDPDGYIYRKE